jgi:hypothetical protein
MGEVVWYVLVKLGLKFKMLKKSFLTPFFPLWLKIQTVKQNGMEQV